MERIFNQQTGRWGLVSVSEVFADFIKHISVRADKDEQCNK